MDDSGGTVGAAPLDDVQDRVNRAARGRDAARLLDALADLSTAGQADDGPPLSVAALSTGPDPPDRLFAWAAGIAERSPGAVTRTLRAAGLLALAQGERPVATATLLAAGAVGLHHRSAGGAVGDLCLAAYLYALHEGEGDERGLFATGLLLTALEAIADERLAPVMRAARRDYRTCRAALAPATTLPDRPECLLAAVLANAVAAAGARAAVPMVDALVAALARIAAAHGAPADLQLELARGLRNAIVAHGRSGRLSRAEEHFAHLQRIRLDDERHPAVQRQLLPSVVSMVAYRAIAGDTVRASELVEWLEGFSNRTGPSPHVDRLLAQARRALHEAARADSLKDSAIVPPDALVMTKALTKLDLQRELMDLIISILDYTPEAREMERDREYRNWNAGVRGFCDFMSVSPLFPALRDIAGEGLPASEPAARRYRAHLFADAPWEAFGNAAHIARAHIDRQPHASFVLSAVAALGWSTSGGDRLFDVSALHHGWLEIPSVLAATAAQLGNWFDADRLIDLGYRMVSAAKAIDGPPGVRNVSRRTADALADYRRFSERVHTMRVNDVANLADDLRECCRAGERDLRAEIGALLFTLGFVPESLLLAPGSSYMPSRSLVRRVVEYSLACVASDGLVQSVWLEILRSPLVRWRDHAAIEHVLRKKAEFRLSSPFPLVEGDGEAIGPGLVDGADSQYSVVTAYAYALIEWFRDPDADAAREWERLLRLSVVRARELMYRGEDNPFLFVRLEAIGGLQHGAAGREHGPAWEALVEQAADGIRAFQVHPECPEAIVTQFNVAVCGYIDETFGAGQELASAALDAIERLREVELQSALETNPPLRLRSPADATREFLDREEMLLRDLRGAYFLIHYPMMPPHYRLYGVRRAPDASGGGTELRPARGRREIAELRRELHELHRAMLEAAPDYAAERMRERPSRETLADSLGSHRRVRR